MCRVQNVAHDSIKACSTKGIVSRLKPIDTDKHGTSRCLKGKRTVCIDDNCEEPESIGIVDNIIKAVLPIVPDKRFATLKVETTTTLGVKGMDRSSGLLKAQVLLAASRQLAVSTSQIAAIGERQPADERSGLLEKMVVDDVFQSIEEGFHGRSQQMSSPC